MVKKGKLDVEKEGQQRGLTEKEMEGGREGVNSAKQREKKRRMKTRNSDTGKDRTWMGRPGEAREGLEI